MNCLNCKSENLLCRISLIVMAPLAKRGGSVAMKGIAVGQKDIKDSWDKTLSGNEQKIRGPIVCADCDTEHVYVRGLQPSLRKMTLEEAMEKGYEYFAATSTKSTEEDEE